MTSGSACTDHGVMNNVTWTHDLRQIGRELWPAGRLVRLIAGLGLLASVAMAVLTRELGPISWAIVGELVMVAALAALAYTLAFALLGDRVLAHLDGWLAAILFVAPPAVLLSLPGTPGWVGPGFFLYVGASLVVQTISGYGGCEIVAVPALLLRRRHTVYCALNGVDIVEGALRRRSGWAAAAVALGAFGLVIAAQVGIEAVGGRTSALWPAYLAFLIVGFLARRIVTATRDRCSEMGS
jgi:hypothetical protein